MDNHGGEQPVQTEKKPTRRFGGIRTLADVRHSNGFFSKLLAFLRETWVDWATLIALGILTGGVSLNEPSRHRSIVLRRESDLFLDITGPTVVVAS